MTAKELGERPAMPDNRLGEGGMTLRQWYAGMALQGFCANTRYKDEGREYRARAAVEQVDEFLKQLAYQQP